MHPRETGRALEALWTGGTMTGLTDAQLLARFARSRDAAAELAFGELLHRHGPMVWGVCRQVLPHAHDADDAFQATFLVLVRKARSLRVGDSLAPWLYSVAYRTAQRARAIAARHRAGTDEQVADLAAAPEEAYTFDIRPLLHEELGRLPGKYRAPIVLCHLEGKTHEEAARLLNCPVGTVSGRLSRGRRLLRSRLERRGVTVPAALLGAAWLTESSSLAMAPPGEAALHVATRFAAAQAVSPSVLSLTEGVLRTMVLRKLTIVSAAVLLVGTVTGGAGAWVHRTVAPTESTSISRPNAEAVPAPGPNASPRAEPGSTADSAPIMADNDRADCPATQSGACGGCPIAMATHVLSRMVGHIHERLAYSK